MNSINQATHRISVNDPAKIGQRYATIAFSTARNDTTTPNIKSTWDGVVQLAGGTITLDLRALPATTPINFENERVRDLSIQTDATNTNAVNIAPAASNGYPLFGIGNTLQLGDSGQTETACFSFVDGLPLVSAALHSITITSVQADAKVKIIMGAGS